MKDRVFMITQLDSQTYAVPRRIFLLQKDEKFISNFKNICADNTINQTLTTTREVLYT